MTPAGIVVSEQLTLVRDGLMSLLSAAWTHGIVRAGATLEETAALLMADGDCILLLDLCQLGASGPAGLSALRDRFPMVRIVVLAGQETRDGILQCLAAGAHGYISKSASFPEVLQAVEAVRRGGVHVPLALTASGASVPRAAAPRFMSPGLRPDAPRRAGVDVLTGRQRDVLMLMAEGRSTKDIARTLDLAVSTIKVHLAAVYRAVGARNRVEALCRAGLLPGRPYAHPTMSIG